VDQSTVLSEFSTNIRIVGGHLPLLFFKKSWYIRTAVVQDKLLSNNQRINWVPEYIKTGSV